MSEVIGQLPSLSDEQISKLNSMTVGLDPTIEPILKHIALAIVDDEAYYWSDDGTSMTALMEMYKDKNLLDILVLQSIDPDRYETELRSAIDRYTRRSRADPLDLVQPSRIPNDYSDSSRRRVRDIMSTIYRIHSTTEDTYNPKELCLSLRRLRPDTGSSAEIYLATYMNQVNMIMKSVMDSDMMNEYLVGIVMNSLRTDIANFVYTYGYSNQDHIVDIQDDISYFSTYLGRRSGVYIEYIENAITLHDIDPSNSVEVVLDNVTSVYSGANYVRLILFQILCAVLYAYHKVQFVHGDLNTGNILITYLPTVQSIPIMIPVSNGQFEKRYILTNVLVMIIDYGQSRVVDSSIYKYKHIISPESGYGLYTVDGGLSNDISLVLIRLFNVVYWKYASTDMSTVLDIGADIHSILYRLYTGDTLQVPQGNLFSALNRLYITYGGDGHRYNTVHPNVRYDYYGAVIEYCNKYMSLFISTDSIEVDSDYTSILSSTVSSTIPLESIGDTRQYYWYSRYTALNDIPIDYDSIETNLWYRLQVIDRIVPSQLLDSTELTNEELILAVIDHIGLNNAIYLMNDLYFYIDYFYAFRLDIRPFKYSDSDEIYNAIGNVLPNIE